MKSDDGFEEILQSNKMILEINKKLRERNLARDEVYEIEEELHAKVNKIENSENLLYKTGLLIENLFKRVLG